VLFCPANQRKRARGKKVHLFSMRFFALFLCFNILWNHENGLNPGFSIRAHFVSHDPTDRKKGVPFSNVAGFKTLVSQAF
jgi:hypothetical protein